MTSEPPVKAPDPPAALVKDITDLRKDLVRLLMMAVPAMLVQLVIKLFQDRLTSQPWQSLWILLPLTIVAWILWQILKGRRGFRLNGVFLGFFCCYVLIFAIAASSSLLDWKRVPVGYEARGVPSNFLALRSFGDWRYRFLRQDEPDQDVSIVLMPAVSSVDERRADLRILIRLAVNSHAKGIAFDMFFPDAAGSAIVDELLCGEVENAAKEKVPVIAGYTYDLVRDQMRRQSTSPTLPCLVPENSGHLVVLADVDDSVRTVPLYFRGAKDQPSLSLRVASRLLGKKENELAAPQTGLLDFVAPSKSPGTITYEELRGDRGAAGFLRDQWVLVGEDSDRDSFKTPFGRVPGVTIHAFAAESLVHGRFISHISFWQNFCLTFAFCYIVIALAAQGVSISRLLMFVSVASVVMVAFAAATIWLWRVWIDVIYFIAAVWLLVPLLAAWRRWGKTGEMG